MESLPRLSGGRALSSDILCRNSEEPECGGGCYPTQAPSRVLGGTKLIEARKLSRYIGALLRADARFAHRSGAKVGVRVQQSLQICLECRSKSKKCDKQLTHIVRVSISFILLVKIYSCSMIIDKLRQRRR
jgi:hypothetical protein